MIVHQCDHTTRIEPWTGNAFVLKDCCCRETDTFEVGSILGNPLECLSNSYSPYLPHLWAWPTDLGCFCWQNMIVSSLDLVCLCLLDYYFSLFLFLKAFEADGSAKGRLARNVFVAALHKWWGGSLRGENSFAVKVLQFAVVRCERVILKGIIIWQYLN